MIKTIFTMYITMMPVILAGVSNMVVVKQKWFKNRAKPMDNGKVLKDGKRILGNNKTWLGFFTMVVCSIITHVAWGLLCKVSDGLYAMNQLYLYYDNTLLYNFIKGLCKRICITCREIFGYVILLVYRTDFTNLFNRGLVGVTAILYIK